jgi:hypothetical protein
MEYQYHAESEGKKEGDKNIINILESVSARNILFNLQLGLQVCHHGPSCS